MLNINILEKAFIGMDYVFHLATVTSLPKFENLAGKGFDINILGT